MRKYENYISFSKKFHIEFYVQTLIEHSENVSYTIIQAKLC